jgi:Leucine-rich repeat (LRR) protein
LVSRRYPSPTPLPQLPLFLLHAGKFFTNLNLEGCSLDKLPLAFGLCFPNLQKLDLSNNSLRELPESFRRLTHRMKFLEKFRICHNQLESLPSDMLSAAATSASAASTKPSLSSSSHAPLLRVLDLSHNQLVSVPSLVGLDNLEVLELHHNALVNMTVADWSRLALRLRSLRMLTREHQSVSDPQKVL